MYHSIALKSEIDIDDAVTILEERLPYGWKVGRAVLPGRDIYVQASPFSGAFISVKPVPKKGATLIKFNSCPPSFLARLILGWLSLFFGGKAVKYVKQVFEDYNRSCNDNNVTPEHLKRYADKPEPEKQYGTKNISEEGFTGEVTTGIWVIFIASIVISGHNLLGVINLFRYVFVFGSFGGIITSLVAIAKAALLFTAGFKLFKLQLSATKYFIISLVMYVINNLTMMFFDGYGLFMIINITELITLACCIGGIVYSRMLAAEGKLY
ncbi:MAG: hypothetical protein D6B27_10955 [Gammaproteobacteria bacterium]|nr:MAG: hypothetical protein D6B27_10955 [Gammaproteobacteria bacterium]